jgi:hypothetical protein
METLKARQDVSLEMSPDEVAGLLAQQDAPMEGAATLQLSTDMIARAMAAEGLVGMPTPRGAMPAQRAHLATAPTAPAPLMSAAALADAKRAVAPTAPPVVAPGPGHSPSRPMPATSTTSATGATAVRREPSAITSGPTTAFREPDSSRQRTMMIGAGVVIAALVSAAVALL